MIDAVEHCLLFTEGYSRNDFVADDKTVQAVCRCLEIVGEAATRTPADLRERFSEIPWPRLVALRNRLIHAYFDVDRDQIWKIVAEDAPKLLSLLQSAIATLERGPG